MSTSPCAHKAYHEFTCLVENRDFFPGRASFLFLTTSKAPSSCQWGFKKRNLLDDMISDVYALIWGMSNALRPFLLIGRRSINFLYPYRRIPKDILIALLTGLKFDRAASQKINESSPLANLIGQFD